MVKNRGPTSPKLILFVCVSAYIHRPASANEILKALNSHDMASLTELHGKRYLWYFVDMAADTRMLITGNLASILWNIDKKCRTSSDATKCGGLSGSALFAYVMYFLNLIGIENYYPTTLKFEMDSSN